MTLAVVWHYWFGFYIFIPTVLLVLAVIGGYFFKVTRNRYPK